MAKHVEPKQRFVAVPEKRWEILTEMEDGSWEFWDEESDEDRPVTREEAMDWLHRAGLDEFVKED